MPKLDRYLSAEFARAVLAALVVLGMVSLGGVFADLIGEMARGKVPPALLLSQLGLRLLSYLPLILPLALLLGLLLSVGRLYRDSEMHVLTAVGVGPRRLLRPVLLVVAPVLLVIAACSLWLGPWAGRLARGMVIEANKNLLVAGLEPGRFTPMANGGVAYAGEMSSDGTKLARVFIFRERGDRMDVATARSGELYRDQGARVLALLDGFRVEGPVAGAVYEHVLEGGQYDSDGDRIDSEWVSTYMHAPEALVGEDLATRDALGNSAHPDKIGNPDNLKYSEAMRTLFIGEDSGNHVNNFLWAYNVDTKELSRILSCPSGAESTGLHAVDNVNGFSYIMSNFQHPGDWESPLHDVVKGILEPYEEANYRDKYSAAVGYLTITGIVG